MHTAQVEVYKGPVKEKGGDARPILSYINFRPRPEVTSRANFTAGRKSTERPDSLRLLSNISLVVNKDISPKVGTKSGNP